MTICSARIMLHVDKGASWKLKSLRDYSIFVNYFARFSFLFIFLLLLLDWTFGFAESRFLLTTIVTNIRDLNAWVSILFVDDFPWSFCFMQHLYTHTHNDDVTKYKIQSVSFFVAVLGDGVRLTHTHSHFRNKGKFSY